MQKNLSLSILILIFSLFFSNSYADDNEQELFARWFKHKNDGVSAVKFEQYNELCGSCHFSYQPGLLPGVSWEKIMQNLAAHFAQAVIMDDVQTRTMRRYLLNNSAGHVNDKISAQILKSFNYRF